MARNPVPIIVPCHRVIRSDGSLGGFGGGLELKRRMLQLESLRVGGGFTTDSRSARRKAD
jgi:methylated-DNA-[protein]-cysteine S-methyltransferase